MEETTIPAFNRKKNIIELQYNINFSQSNEIFDTCLTVGCYFLTQSVTFPSVD